MTISKDVNKAKAKKSILVLLTYDFSPSFKEPGSFEAILKGLGWVYQFGNSRLPSGTCVKEFKEAKGEQGAVNLAMTELGSVFEKIQSSNKELGEFQFSRYFLLAHVVPSSVGVFGDNEVKAG